MDLFAHSSDDLTGPLADKLRPQSIAEFFGQEFLTNEKSNYIKWIRERNFLPNLILWGPPGTGKTTFAMILSREAKAHFESCNAIDTGAKDLRAMGSAAQDRRRQFGERSILFIDEIHRLNKSQQDVLLPFLERGDLILIGATTENPSYELSSALLSRSQVVVFNLLDETALKSILERALLKTGIRLEQLFDTEAVTVMVQMAQGDARHLLNNLEIIIQDFQSEPLSKSFPLTSENLGRFNFRAKIRYDKNRDQHYDVISAFIKSVRGSDPDAAIYYLARMLEGGEDPVFIARRLVILASEDIGNADPRALTLAVSGLQAVELVGMPEARISLAQVCVYLACAPKSNRAYSAINKAISYVQQTGALDVPKSLRSAQTKLARELGHGVNYQYSHDSVRGYIDQDFLPEAAKDQRFYEPSEHGFEKNMSAYLSWLRGEKVKDPEGKS